MANWHLEFYQDDTGYSDGDIELEMLDVVKNHTDYHSVLSTDDRWPMFYHLSELRHNVFSWYPFEKNASLLEIGSGCGALTGLFCEKVDHVTSVELTKIRSEINFERNKKYDNLDLFTGNFNAMTFPEQFDYIILNGVLEYAVSFTEGDSPFVTFLSGIRNLLKKDGVLLIAIENRLGLKYFNGAVEDHTSALFSGLDAYRDVDFVRTFSKGEMNTLLDDSGYGDRRFYYPFPDYKFPMEILTDATINTMDFSYRRTNAAYDHDRLNFFDENKMLETLRSEGVCDRFANSFIVEVKKSGILADNGIEYVKFSNNRRKDFNITTFINREEGQRLVKKTALSDGAKTHLDKMINHYKRRQNNQGPFLYAPVYPIKDGLTMAHFKLPTMESVLNTYLKTGDLDAFNREIDALKAYMYQGAESAAYGDSPDFVSVFGNEGIRHDAEPCQTHANIDLLFGNIFMNREQGKYYIIDYEWVFDFAIPVKFILWRCLFYYYLSSAEITYRYTLSEFLERHGITEDDHARYLRWEAHFTDEYVSDHPVSLRYVKETYYQTPALNQFIRDFDRSVEIYYGQSGVFTADMMITDTLSLVRDRFRIDVDLDALRSQCDDEHLPDTFRIDPCNQSCVIGDLTVTDDKGEKIVFETNAFDHHERDLMFMDDDPQIIVSGISDQTKSLHLEGSLKRYALIDRVNAISRMKAELTERLAAMENEKNIIEQQYINVNDQLTAIKNSAAWKASAPLRKARKLLK